MKALKYFIAASIAAALAFTSCTKEIETSDKPEQEGESSEKLGAPVVFGVSTSHSNEPDTKAGLSEEIFTSVDGKLEKIGEMSVGYNNGPETKAQYSGEIFQDENGAKFERIDWEIGDTLRIHYPRNSHNSAKYKISSPPSNNGITSKANVKSLEGTGLQWLKGTGPHTFFGVYPETGKRGSNRILESSRIQNNTGIRLKAVVPHTKRWIKAEEDAMRYDVPIMAGGCIVETPENEPVNLPLSPQVNTFDIELINAATFTVIIPSIGLLSDKILAGAYYIDLAPDETGKIKSTYTIIDDTNKSNSVELSFRPNNKACVLAPGQRLKVRLYTIPQELTKLTLMVYMKTFNTTGHTYYLKLKTYTGWLSVAQGQKANLKILLPNINTTPRFYFLSNFTEKDTLFYPPFKIQYPKGMKKKPMGKPLKVVSYKKMADNDTRYPVRWSYDLTTNIFEPNFHGRQVTYKGSIVDNVNEGEEFDLFLRELKELKEIDPRDEKQDYYENVIRKQLRERTPAHNKDLSIMENGKRNTANCYRVTSKGTYKFPLIYGNSIKDGNVNENAFNRVTDHTSHYMDGLGKFINANNYKIKSPSSVELVWEESKGMIEKLSIGKENNEYYVYFKLGDKIDYGSALIAVRSGGKIIWSWHIWVVEDIDDNKISSGSLSQRPLGYAPDRGGIKAIDFKVKLYQFDKNDNGNSLYVNVKSERGYSSSTCLYYIHGRTAPSIPASGQYYKEKHENKETPVNNVTNLRECYTASFSQSGERLPNTEKIFEHNFSDSYYLNIQNAINSPQTLAPLEPDWTANGRYKDLWDVHPSYYNNTGTKSVYDPCPAGYRVPLFTETGIAHNKHKYDHFPKYGHLDLVPYSINGTIKTWGGVVKEFSQTLQAWCARDDNFSVPYSVYYSNNYATIFPMKE